MVFVLLSPAKTMRFDHPRPDITGEIPYFQKQATLLAGILKKKNADEIKRLMDISDKLAQLNVLRYKNFSPKPTEKETDLAIVAYQGDVYQGFDAKTLSDEQIEASQKHIGILSGLYGLLQPLDLIQPYRLEMSTRFMIARHQGLYQYWGEDITDYINKLVKLYKREAVIGCASNEYLDAVQTGQLIVPFINCTFKEKKGNDYTIVALFAKKARGMMARYVVENNITNPQDLKNFKSGKYAFNKALSSDDNYVFTR